VPVRLSLAGLGSVTDSVNVHVTISPVMPATPGMPVTSVTGDVSVSFSHVHMGAVSLLPTFKRAGNTFTADFTSVVVAGSAQLDFDFGGHSYRGRHSDRGDFLVTAEVTFQADGKQAPTVLASSALIRL
jgi:hypothetical protein